MVISKMSLLLKCFICIDAIALNYRVNVLILYLLHTKTKMRLRVIALNRTLRAIREIAPLRIIGESYGINKDSAFHRRLSRRY
jgi:hypothetical protein